MIPHDGPSAFKFLALSRKAEAILDGLIHEAPCANGAGAHALAIRLRDSGQLAELLRSFVTGSASARRVTSGNGESGASAAAVASEVSSHSTPLLPPLPPAPALTPMPPLTPPSPPPSNSPSPIVEAVEVGPTTCYVLNLAALKSYHHAHGCYPSVAVAAMRSAVSSTGFIMVRPEPEATELGEADKDANTSCATGRPITASAAKACYKQLRALVDIDEVTKSSWSCAAAKAQVGSLPRAATQQLNKCHAPSILSLCCVVFARVGICSNHHAPLVLLPHQQGLLGGCLTGNGGDYNCDSYRCSVEQPLEHYGYVRGSTSVALDEAEDDEPSTRGSFKQHLWPPLANFREDVEGYAAATVSLAHTVLGVMEEALALPKGTYYVDVSNTARPVLLSRQALDLAGARTHRWPLSFQITLSPK